MLSFSECFVSFTFVQPDYLPLQPTDWNFFCWMLLFMVFSKISLTFLLLSMKTAFGISSGPRHFFLLSLLMALFISSSGVLSDFRHGWYY